MVTKEIQNLNEKARQFSKLAGILQIPTKLYDQISEYMIGCYCWHVVNALNGIINNNPNHPHKKYWLLIRGIAKEKENKQKIDSVNKEFELSMDELPYQDKILPQMFWKAKSRRWIVKTHFRSNANKNDAIYNKEDWSGLWVPKKDLEKAIILGDLYVSRNVKRDVERMIDGNYEIMDYAWKEIKNIVRHELQHLIQSLLKYLLDLKEIGGLPERKFREQDRDPQGYLLQFEHGKTQNTDSDPHELRDQEFYTRLADDIAEFNNYKRYVPADLHNDYLKAWIGQITEAQFKQIIFNNKRMQDMGKKWDSGDESDIKQWNVLDYAFNALGRSNLFFLGLKRFSPLKWRKAVKEIVKAVS